MTAQYGATRKLAAAQAYTPMTSGIALLRNAAQCCIMLGAGLSSSPYVVCAVQPQEESNDTVKSLMY